MAGHIFIYGGIGLNKREGEISAEDVRTQIDAEKGESELVVHIISPGGDVFEGESIYNALKNTGKKITTHIEGTCASIATLIAAAGEKIVMNKTARFMIHNPKISGLQTSADSRDLRHVADQLDQIKTLLINVYKAKTALSQEKLWELYDNETWLTADQAQQMGFIDESVDAIKAVAKVDLNKIRMENTLMQKVKAFKNLLGLTKVKNEFTESLEDGTVIVVMSDDDDWTGKQVVYQDGSPLPADTYKLVTGKTFTVDESSTITQVTEAPAPEDQQQDEEMNNKIKELEAQLAEAKGAKETAEAAAKAAQAEAATAKSNTIKFENRVKDLEKKHLELMEEVRKTVGDQSEPTRGKAVIKNSQTQQESDPMGQEVLKYFRNRNIIQKNED